MDILGVQLPMKFDGPDYDPHWDDTRLTGQIQRIWSVMKDGTWRTLAEIEGLTGDGQASISAQLRHLRKPRFGEYTVLKRRRGIKEQGLFEYQLTINKPKNEQNKIDFIEEL